MIKALHLDKQTSHGGWPSGHGGSWINKKPVNLQLIDYFEDMAMLEDLPHARLSEENLRKLIRKVLLENYIYI